MLSKTLIKLVDEAILPAVVLVAAKVLSTFAVNAYLNLKWEWRDFGLVYFSNGDFLKANSYSAAAMFGVILAFTLWIILKSLVSHETHIHPITSVRLVGANLASLIQSSFELYSQATVWLSYSWLTMILLGILAFSGLVYPAVFYGSLLLTIATSVIMIIDVEREVKADHD